MDVCDTVLVCCCCLVFAVDFVVGITARFYIYIYIIMFCDINLACMLLRSLKL